MTNHIRRTRCLWLTGALLAGCHRKTINGSKGEAGIRSFFEQGGYAVTSVTCPEGRAMRKDDVFYCSVTTEGITIKVENKQLNDDGKVTSLGLGYIETNRVVDMVEQRAHEKGMTDAKADCGPKLRLGTTDDRFECILTSSTRRFAIPIRVKDDRGKWIVEFESARRLSEPAAPP